MYIYCIVLINVVLLQHRISGKRKDRKAEIEKRRTTASVGSYTTLDVRH